MFMLLSVLALCFLSEFTLFAIFDNAEAFVVLATNINHQSTVCFKQTKIRLSHATRYKTTKHRSLVTNTKQPYTVSVYQNIKKPYVVSHETNHQTIQPAGSNKTSQSL